MSRTIWKYPFETRDGVVLDLPKGAKVLSVQVQGGVPCLWALVEPAADPEPRWFRIYGTGHPVDDAAGSYVGTYQLHGGALIFHVFEPAAPLAAEPATPAVEEAP